MIEAALDTLRPAAEAKGVRLETMLDPGAGAISGDANRVQQIVWNLLSNAIKFVPERTGRVRVRLEAAFPHVRLTVEDNGPGIDPAFLPHVFDRFRQEESGRTADPRVWDWGWPSCGNSWSFMAAPSRPQTFPTARERVSRFSCRAGAWPAPSRWWRPPSGTCRRSNRCGWTRRHPWRGCGSSWWTTRRTLAAAEGGAAALRCYGGGRGLGRRSLGHDGEREATRGPLGRRDAGAKRIRLPPAASIATRGEGRPDTGGGVDRLRLGPRRVKLLRAGFQMHVPKPVQPAELATVVASLAKKDG